MTSYHHHLLKGFLQNLVRSLAVLVVVQLVVGLPGIVDRFSGPAPPLLDVLSATVLLLLAFLDLALPLALLLATLFTVGNLARYQELTALRVAGQSTFQILRSVLLVAVAAVALSGTLRLLGVNSPADSATERHASNAYPFLNLLAVLVGIPLAASPRRSTVFVGFGRALAALLVYHVVNAGLLALGRIDVLPPVIAGWSGPAIFTAGISVLWWRARL